MTNYYYTHNPDIVHDEKQWQFEIFNHQFTFTTDNGVFSKRTVDYGSRTLLSAFEPTDLPDGPLLDLGTGYGPIGLALAYQSPERTVTMVDVNELALSLARKNAALNQLTNVDILTSDSYEQLAGKTYAGIVTNPPVRAGKAVVETMLTGAYDHLMTQGTLTVVLQKKQGAPSAKKLMTTTFGNCTIIKKDKGYYILQSVKEA
ncbi:class I SAM-dependent methyltransferase [Lactiplantibacillus mudanjiangensis]|uniref:16S rRNA methyltransferase [Lactobacillus sp.] n=1 Tax=Lactiplantibacillus mudanjiangensis TaxID=1296538 RepID=A0A660DYS7_9LACO|nr:class I SAM-dependent methyltransferase [Lactiplantibacillus mudanjiangensis]VDG17986.1 16S rRNA methyltransferase [Lactobacillus sp.] [Lactiplantibacillus mudanjiangensis]VDG24848.1 16S rRNA methyltransferase [Lactobacillus sp.] [Lactiplantibacillus mudanjiangensis]VDG28404.1 16S rRNA methyltransferase [Lactobacillus sp.] [Lactiplantibacillus mudanjiangensis]VDG32311.1 16S rRNA methyltransferase [Lactobacillus sp.] [Lactiplantibacillus mudanjiangensis]